MPEQAPPSALLPQPRWSRCNNSCGGARLREVTVTAVTSHPFESSNGSLDSNSYFILAGVHILLGLNVLTLGLYITSIQSRKTVSHIVITDL